MAKKRPEENVAQEASNLTSPGAECGKCEEQAACGDAQAPAAPPETAAGAAPKEKKIVANPTYKLNLDREKKEGEKPLPKQAGQIVDLIAKAGETGITRENLLKEMVGVIETRQPLDRILAFYNPRLKTEGYVLIVG